MVAASGRGASQGAPFRSIRLPAVIGGQHEDDALPLIHPIEEAIIPNAIPPGLGYRVPKLLDVLSEVGVLTRLGINVGGQLLLNASLLSTKVLLEIALKLRGFKDSKLSQRTFPSAALRRGGRPGAWPSGAYPT